MVDTVYILRQSPSGKRVRIVVPSGGGGGGGLFSAYLDAVTATSWAVAADPLWVVATPVGGSAWAVDDAHADWSLDVATGIATYIGAAKTWLLTGGVTAYTEAGGGGAIWAAFDVDGDQAGTARYTGGRNTASGMDADGDLKGVALGPSRRVACTPGMVIQLVFSNPGAGCRIQLAQVRFTEHS